MRRGWLPDYTYQVTPGLPPTPISGPEAAWEREDCKGLASVRDYLCKLAPGRTPPIPTTLSGHMPWLMFGSLFLKFLEDFEPMIHFLTVLSSKKMNEL